MIRRKNIQLAYPFEESRLAKWKPPYIVQPKLDGVRCRAIPIKNGSEQNNYTIVSSEENPFWCLPHIQVALDELNLDIELDGELYIHNEPFEYISSISSRDVNCHPDYEKLEYHIFDLVDENMITLDRMSNLYNLEW